MKSILITIPNDPEEAANLAEVVRVFAAPRGLPENVVTAVDHILEECLINTIEHAYDDDLEHEISVKLSLGTGEVAIRIEDDGREFNPLASPRKEISDSPPETTKGVGIQIIRNMMNAMTYSREKGKNILELWIYFQPGENGA